MKKFKLIALSLLAATFGLTSCELPDFIKNLIPGQQVNPTPEPEPEPQPKPQPQPEVVSVKIRTAVTEVTDETAPFKLVAAVAVKYGASNGVTWSSSNSSVGTVDQNGLFTPVAEGKTTITATSTADSSKKDSVEMTVVAVPGVLSVTIQNAPEKVYLHQAVELEAVVAAKGTVTDAVSWSSSDESIATVDDSGKILFSAEGKVTFTVKSRFDASKSDSVEIEGVDGGLHPEIIEEGFTYSKTWPTAALNEYLGEEAFSLEEANGFYSKHNEAKEATEETSATASNFIIVSEYTQAYVQSFATAVDSYVGFEDEDNGLFCFVSPNQTHEVDFGAVALDEEGENLLSQIVFYHVDEIWESSENTTDTEWNDEVKEAIEENGVEIPFVTLGEKYNSYVYSDGTVEISDYCADFNKLNGYEEIVLAAGFEKVETTDGSHLFVKNLQYKEIYLGYLFGLYGNTIDAWVELVPLDAYPSEYMDPFIQSIPSKYTLPAFDAGDTYYFNYGKVDLGEDEEDIRDAASVQVVGVKEEDCTAYVGSLIQDGFKEIQSFDKVEGFSGVMLQKGKLVVLAEIEYESRDATEEEIAAFNAITEEEVAAMTDEERAEYYTKLLTLLFTGTFPVYEYDSVVAAYLTVCGDPEGMEDPGVYLAGSSATIALEETLQLEPIFFEMEQTAVSYNSSDESIASVSAEGLVTAIAEGDAVITVSAMLGEQEVSDSITIHVVKSTSAIAAFVEEANAIFAEMGAEEELVLPDPEATKVWPEPYSGWDEENQTYYINLQTEMTPEQYISLLSDDYEIGVDEEGDPIATNGIYVVGAYYDSYGDLMIYVYLYEEVPPVEGDTVTFSEMGYENAQDLDGAVYTLGSGATITLSVGEGSTTPKYYSTGAGLRIYQKNTITVVAPEGESLGSIEIEMSQFNKKYSCDVGTIEEGNSSIIWTAPEDCSSVTFTIEDGSGHNRVTSITVSLA